MNLDVFHIFDIQEAVFLPLLVEMFYHFEFVKDFLLRELLFHPLSKQKVFVEMKRKAHHGQSRDERGVAKEGRGAGHFELPFYLCRHCLGYK